MKAATVPALSVAIALLVAAVSPLRAQDGPSLELVLARASIYASDFARDLPGIAAEETYVQDVLGGSAFWNSRYVTHRRMKSDLLLVRPAGDRLVEMRDVFEADGKAVRDRDERLMRLFLDGSASSDEQLRQILAESARYNIGNIFRNVNIPTLPLQFLEPESLGRFTFSRSGDAKRPLDAGRDRAARARLEQAWVIDYKETQTGTFIRRNSAGDDLPVHGRFWIAPDTGQVLLTEMVFQDARMRGTIDVRFGSESVPGFLLPVEMRESYLTDAGLETRGVANYSNFRRFQVQVDQQIDAPPR